MDYSELLPRESRRPPTSRSYTPGTDSAFWCLSVFPDWNVSENRENAGPVFRTGAVWGTGGEDWAVGAHFGAAFVLGRFGAAVGPNKGEVDAVAGDAELVESLGLRLSVSR